MVAINQANPVEDEPEIKKDTEMPGNPGRLRNESIISYLTRN